MAKVAVAATLPAHAVESCDGLACAPGTRELLYRESHRNGRQLVVDIDLPAARRNSNVARSEAGAAIAARLVKRCPG
ncbi:MAG: hypothetical protein M3R16_08990 [Pseudomonadota bacterium]|nr:hypothetical protein [Pseudomonadota bacterium]